jgi:hypothetical protein
MLVDFNRILNHGQTHNEGQPVRGGNAGCPLGGTKAAMNKNGSGLVINTKANPFSASERSCDTQANTEVVTYKYIGVYLVTFSKLGMS